MPRESGDVPLIVKTDSGLTLVNVSDLNRNDKRKAGGSFFSGSQRLKKSYRRQNFVFSLRRFRAPMLPSTVACLCALRFA